MRFSSPPSPLLETVRLICPSLTRRNSPQEPDVSPQWQQQEAIRSPDSPARSPHLQDGACHRPRVPHPRRARQGRKRTRPKGVPPLPRRSGHRSAVVLDGVPQGQEVRRLEDARSQDQGGEDSAVRSKAPLIVCGYRRKNHLVLIVFSARAAGSRRSRPSRRCTRSTRKRLVSATSARRPLSTLGKSGASLVHHLTPSPPTTKLTRPARQFALQALGCAGRGRQPENERSRRSDPAH